MKTILMTVCFLSSIHLFAQQQEGTKWLRAFPVTNYILDLNDSIKLVQVQLPEGHFFKEKQIGLLQGVYRTEAADTVSKGAGKCYLIKNDYYYFAINNNNNPPIKEGDLLYTLQDASMVYAGLLPKLASHFIQLQNVYEDRFYDRYIIFLSWTKVDEQKALDSIIKDIQFTGRYYLENDPSVDKEIQTGKYKGNKVLSQMTVCDNSILTEFLQYIIARPRLYAGRQWKVAEIFATWLSEGAPTVILN